MTNCKQCKSKRIAKVDGKTSDMCYISINGNVSNDYVPYDMGIGGGDNLEFDFCMDCGQMAGKFPLPTSKLEENAEEE
jgi:hypothetical protein